MRRAKKDNDSEIALCILFGPQDIVKSLSVEELLCTRKYNVIKAGLSLQPN